MGTPLGGLGARGQGRRGAARSAAPWAGCWPGLAFRAPSATFRFAEAGEAVVALGAVLLAYGVAEAMQGYGFLAVFAAALIIRTHESRHEYHHVLHSFIEQIERCSP